MSNFHTMTVHTAAAHPHHSGMVTNQDAKAIADGVAKQTKAAIAQAVTDAASLADAKLRRIVEKKLGAEVADALAGVALAEMARQVGHVDGELTPNTNRFEPLTADISSLPKE